MQIVQVKANSDNLPMICFLSPIYVEESRLWILLI